MLKSFFQYYLKADTKYRVHSPFVFDLLTEVIENSGYYYAFDHLKLLRNRLSKNNELIEVLDLGAGSKKNSGNKRKISDILKVSVSPDWQCRFLFRLVNHLQPDSVLEMGSSLGLSSMALHFGNKSAQMVSLEGSPEIARIAKENFKLLNANKIELNVGSFDDTLPQALKNLKKIDLAFIDGNHQKKPTIEYFEKILPFTHSKTVLIFDDIYWSDEMKSAWEELKNHHAVTMTIDLFWCGILFFNTDFKEKQHFRLIPHRFKPWQSGFFR